MAIESVAVGKLLAETAKYGLIAGSDAMSTGNSRLGRFIQAYAPEGTVHWFENRRLRLSQIKAQEQIFNDMCNSIVTEYKKRAQKLASSTKRLQNPVVQSTIAEMEGDLRLLDTIRLALSYCPKTKRLDAPIDANSEGECTAEHTVDVSWWDTIESLARRRNEAWRTELLARAMVEYDREPGCIRLKSIWEIGMMESDDFGLLAAFCDSSLYIDKKAMVLLAPEEMAKFRFDADDSIREVNLAYAVSALMDTGLIVQSSVQFDTSQPVVLGYKSGPTTFIHQYAARTELDTTAIQIDGFGANDIAMDICRLYAPKQNVASDASFDIFKELMVEEAKNNPEKMGKVTFVP